MGKKQSNPAPDFPKPLPPPSPPMTKDPKSWNGKFGDWMDDMGACKVCGGEIPHGHSEACDYYKLEHLINEVAAHLNKGDTELAKKKIFKLFPHLKHR